MLRTSTADFFLIFFKGRVDVGITGQDLIQESKADVIELSRLGFGKCRLCVQAPKKAGIKDVQVSITSSNLLAIYNMITIKGNLVLGSNIISNTISCLVTGRQANHHLVPQFDRTILQKIGSQHPYHDQIHFWIGWNCLCLGLGRCYCRFGWIWCHDESCRYDRFDTWLTQLQH